jgi:RNA recognition motif-containing protein
MSVSVGLNKFAAAGSPTPPVGTVLAVGDCSTVLPAPPAHVLQQAASPDTAVRRTVYVSHLDSNISDAELRRILEESGDFHKVRLRGETEGRCKYAFVEFATVEAAQKMLDFPKLWPGAKQLRASAAKKAIEGNDPRDAVLPGTKRGTPRPCVFGLNVEINTTPPARLQKGLSASINEAKVGLSKSENSKDAITSTASIATSTTGLMDGNRLARSETLPKAPPLFDGERLL